MLPSLLALQRPPATPGTPDVDAEAIRDAALRAAREALEGMQVEAQIPPPAPRPPMPPEFELAIIIIIAVLATIALMAIGIPIARAVVRRMDHRSAQPALTPGLESRFERLEQAVEAVAIEVERISEAQRYSAKLLTERLPKAVPERSGGGSVG